MTLIAHVQSQLEAARIRAHVLPDIQPEPPTPPKNPLEWRNVVREVCDRHRLSVEAVLGPCRAQRFAYPRFEIMYLLRRRGVSLSWIGARMGGRDHTSVLSGLKRYDELTASGRFLKHMVRYGLV